MFRGIQIFKIYTVAFPAELYKRDYTSSDNDSALPALLLDSSALPIGRSCFIGAAQHKSHSHSYIANVAVSVSASFIKQPWKEIRNYAANRKKKNIPLVSYKLIIPKNWRASESCCIHFFCWNIFINGKIWWCEMCMVCYRVPIISQYGSL